MNCHSCGHRQSDPQAAFCGQCGVVLAQESWRVVPTTAPDSLEAALHQLAALIDEQGCLPPQSALALRAMAAAETSENKPTVVVVGDDRRGKSTVINRLLGQNLLPTTPCQEDRAMRVRFGRGGLRPDSSMERWCQAPILSGLDLVDTSCWNTSDANQVSTAVRQAILASAIVFCIDARQPLSASERRILKEELLPLTSCPILLAVTFVDQVTDAADRAEIRQWLASFVARAGEDRMELMLLEAGSKAGEPVYELEQWISSRTARQPLPAANRMIRLGALLDLIEQSIPSPASGAGEAGAEQRERLLAVLGREHKLAILEATALFREKCSRLRADIASILRSLSEESHGREGVAYVVRKLRTIVRESGAAYLATLQRSLQADGLPMLEISAAAIDADASLDVHAPDAPRLLSAPPSRPSRRDWRAGGVAAAALVVTAIAGSWLSVVGAGVTLVAVNNWRTGRRRQSTADSFEASEAALRNWLIEVEPLMIDELRAAADEVLLQICEQVSRQITPESNPGGDVELRESIALCRRLLPLEER